MGLEQNSVVVTSPLLASESSRGGAPGQRRIEGGPAAAVAGVAGSDGGDSGDDSSGVGQPLQALGDRSVADGSDVGVEGGGGGDSGTDRRDSHGSTDTSVVELA